MQSFVKKLMNYRKNSQAIHKGKTIHFAPENGVYVLVRMLDNEIVITILNKNDHPVTLDLKRFDEMGLKGRAVKNIISNEEFVWGDSLTLNDKGSIVLTTKL